MPFYGGLNGDGFGDEPEHFEQMDDSDYRFNHKSNKLKPVYSNTKTLSPEESEYVYHTPILDVFKNAKVVKETDNAYLYEYKPDDIKDLNVCFWVPKKLLKNRKVSIPNKKNKKTVVYIWNNFKPTFIEKTIDKKKDNEKDNSDENYNPYELPPFYPVYEEAVKQKLEVLNIGSHLLLLIDKKSTILKDKFVESGGKNNWHIYNDVDKEYYVFYAQYSPWFKDKEKEKLKKD